MKIINTHSHTIPGKANFTPTFFLYVGNDSSSRLYGMPPLPEIGKPATTGMVDSSAIFVPKKPLQTSDPNPSSNIFASAIKESNVENKVNVFSKPPSGTYKPDLFQSIEPAAKGLFQGGPTTSVKSTFGAFKPQETSNIFKAPAVSESTNLFPKPPENKIPFTIPKPLSQYFRISIVSDLSFSIDINCMRSDSCISNVELLSYVLLRVVYGQLLLVEICNTCYIILPNSLLCPIL